MEKTCTLVGGVVSTGGKGNKRFAHQDYRLYYRGTEIPVVQLFKYLGLEFDGTRSTRSMIRHRLLEARKAWGRLMGKLISRGWQDRATRLVLYDVFVRSVLLYGCTVWGTTFVRENGELVVG